MHAALLLIGSLLQPAEKLPTQPTLYLLIGKNRPSEILESELKRDWFKLRSYEKSHVFHALILANERREIRARIVFIRHDRWSDIKTPQWKIGRYGKWQEFDPRAFVFTGRPTRTVRWLVDYYLTEPIRVVYERRDFEGGEFSYNEKAYYNKRPLPPWEKRGE